MKKKARKLFAWEKKILEQEEKTKARDMARKEKQRLRMKAYQDNLSARKHAKQVATVLKRYHERKAQMSNEEYVKFVSRQRNYAREYYKKNIEAMIDKQRRSRSKKKGNEAPIRKIFKHLFPHDVIRNMNSFMSIAPRKYLYIYEGNEINVSAGRIYKATVLRGPHFDEDGDILCHVKWENGGDEIVHIEQCSEIMHNGKLRNEKKISEEHLQKRPFLII